MAEMVPHKQFYTHGTVIAVDLNVDVQKRSGELYKGSRVTYRDDLGQIKEQAINQTHLDRVQQATLKGEFSKTKAGDKITFYKARLVNPEDIDLPINEAKERYPFIALLRIHEGHIIPPEMSAPTQAAPAAPVAQAAPKDHAGMLTGHALTCASHLLTPAKAKDKKVLESAAVAIAELTEKLVQAQSGDKYLAGLRVGNAVTCACITVGQFADVESQALLVLNVSENVKARITDMQEAEADKTVEAARKEEQALVIAQAKAEKAAQERADVEAAKAAEQEKVELEDDDIPF